MVTSIRELIFDDYEAIIELWALAGLPFKPKGRDSRELLGKEMSFPGAKFYGMYDDDLLIGVCIANFDGRRGWINRLAIHPDYRGKNLGGQLIDVCEKFLYAIGANIICALIEDINYPSITVFNKAGYNCEETIKYCAKRPSADM